MRHLIVTAGLLSALGACTVEFPEAPVMDADAPDAWDAAPRARDQRPPVPDTTPAPPDGAGPEAGCVPEPERCDGLDNDCDNQIDEGLGIGQPCGEGLGLCRATGLIECGPGGEPVCSGRPSAPQPEICDGLDNDCDGVVDELPGLGEPCANRAPLSVDCETEGVLVCEPEAGGVRCDGPPADVDGDGYGCADDCDDGDPAVHRGAVERCNLVDDDCDGAIDEGLADCDCAPLVRGGRRYLACLSPASWEGARAICQDHRADLVILEAEGEQRWLLAEAERIGGPRAWWVGARRLPGEAAFAWYDGAPLGFTRWARLEPSPAVPPPAGVLVDGRLGGDWLANDVGFAASFLCEERCTGELDRDQDGFSKCGADCDDTARNVNPDAVEICGNGIDDNCDGRVDEPPCP